MTAEQPPQSFLNTRASWMLGGLSLPQLLEIPRRPEILDEVPDFGLDEPTFLQLYPDGGKVAPVDILRGASFEPHRNYDHNLLERGLRGALNVILNHSVSVMGLDLDRSRVQLRILCEPGSKQWEGFPYMHLDSPHQGDTLYVYTIASPAASIFLDESVALPKGFSFGGVRGRDAFNALTADKRRFQPEPKRVVLFDETIAHSVPPPNPDRPKTADDLRTFMRVWISSRLPVSQLLRL